MFEFKKGQAVIMPDIKVVEGIPCNCPNCGINLIPSNGIVPLGIGNFKIACSECEHDVTDIYRLIVGDPSKRPNRIFGIGSIEVIK